MSFKFHYEDGRWSASYDPLDDYFESPQQVKPQAPIPDAGNDYYGIEVPIIPLVMAFPVHPAEHS